MVEVGHHIGSNPEAWSAAVIFPFPLARVSWKEDFIVSRDGQIYFIECLWWVSGRFNYVNESTFTVTKKKGKKGEKITGPRNGSTRVGSKRIADSLISHGFVISMALTKKILVKNQVLFSSLHFLKFDSAVLH